MMSSALTSGALVASTNSSTTLVIGVTSALRKPGSFSGKIVFFAKSSLLAKIFVVASTVRSPSVTTSLG